MSVGRAARFAGDRFGGWAERRAAGPDHGCVRAGRSVLRLRANAINALNQRGNVMDIRVYEQYKSQGKRTYMPIPFMLSSAGYGVYVESSRWMQFDLTAPDRWVLEADFGEDQALRLVLVQG